MSVTKFYNLKTFTSEKQAEELIERLILRYEERKNIRWAITLRKRIEAVYDPRNVSSGRVLEKNGFKYEGTLKQRYFEKGRFVDTAIRAILKEDYQ